MSNLEAVSKVADQLVSRLFDQRQFTGGEINHMVKELGENVDLDGNFDRLLRMNENVCVISDTGREDMCSAHDASQRNINDQEPQERTERLTRMSSVASLLGRMESILKLENECRGKEETVLGQLRRDMEAKKQACMRECNMKLEKLKESIVEEELELERKYLKFEENLRNK